MQRVAARIADMADALEQITLLISDRTVALKKMLSDLGDDAR